MLYMNVSYTGMCAVQEYIQSRNVGSLEIYIVSDYMQPRSLCSVQMCAVQ